MIKVTEREPAPDSDSNGCATVHPTDPLDTGNDQSKSDRENSEEDASSTKNTKTTTTATHVIVHRPVDVHPVSDTGSWVSAVSLSHPNGTGIRIVQRQESKYRKQNKTRAFYRKIQSQSSGDSGENVQNSSSKYKFEKKLASLEKQLDKLEGKLKKTEQLLSQVSTYVPTYPPTSYLPTHQPTYLPTYLPAYLPIYLSLYIYAGCEELDLRMQQMFERVKPALTAKEVPYPTLPIPYLT